MPFGIGPAEICVLAVPLGLFAGAVALIIWLVRRLQNISERLESIESELQRRNGQSR